ncbi:MAG: glycosyltransferase family 4 protein [Bacteroidales bacterium]
MGPADIPAAHVQRHHTLLNQFGNGWSFRLLMYLLRTRVRSRIIASETRVFATVPENAAILKTRYGLPEDRIGSSPIGTDATLFRFDEEAGAGLRRSLGLPDREFILLYTGKLNTRKNPHLILEALARVEDRIEEPLHLCFVGQGDPDYLDRHFNVTFRNERIRIHRFEAVKMDELFAWYSMADLAVFPDENTLSALDAQACRLPVVMKDDLTNAERLRFGGVTYEPGNLSDLGEKIRELLADPDRLRALGRAGEGHVLSKYDYRAIVRDMEIELGII